MYGHKQTDRQTYIHTHVRNAVTLVWGSLRLAPISVLSSFFINFTPSSSRCSDCYDLFFFTRSCCYRLLILPAMALQNEIVKSNIWCLSRSSSHASVHRVSFSPVFSVPSGLGRMVVGAVVVLLLLMSGDIETNPGPVGECINMRY